MTNTQLIVFMAIVTGFFLTVVMVGAILFARWSKLEKERGRRQIEASLAAAQRRPKDD